MAFRVSAKVDGTLPVRVRDSWRWRILYMRALIDSELAEHQFRVSEKCAAAFREPTTMYHAEKAVDMVAPPRGLSGVIGPEP